MGQPRLMMLGAGDEAAQFIAAGKRDGSAALLVDLQAQVAPIYPGYCMVVVPYGAAPTSGSGEAWTKAAPINSGQFPYYRVLSAADIAAPVRLINSGVWAVYRGFTSLVLRTSGAQTAGGPNLAGFAKSPQAVGLLYAGDGYDNTAKPSVGALGVMRADWQLVSGPSVTRSLGDILPPSAYPDGAAIGTGGSSNGGTRAAIYEMHR